MKAYAAAEPTPKRGFVSFQTDCSWWAGVSCELLRIAGGCEQKLPIMIKSSLPPASYSSWRELNCALHMHRLSLISPSLEKKKRRKILTCTPCSAFHVTMIAEMRMLFWAPAGLDALWYFAPSSTSRIANHYRTSVVILHDVCHILTASRATLAELLLHHWTIGDYTVACWSKRALLHVASPPRIRGPNLFR